MELPLCPTCLAPTAPGARRCEACGARFDAPKLIEAIELAALPRRPCPRCWRSSPVQASVCPRCRAPMKGDVRLLAMSTQAWLDSAGSFHDTHLVALGGALPLDQVEAKLREAFTVNRVTPAEGGFRARVALPGAPVLTDDEGPVMGFDLGFSVDGEDLVVQGHDGDKGLAFFSAMYRVARLFSERVLDRETGRELDKEPTELRHCFAVVVEKADGWAWVRTAGLPRLGRPDLERLDVPEAEVADAVLQVQAYAETLVPGDLPPPGEELAGLTWLPFEHLSLLPRGPGGSRADRKVFPHGSFVLRKAPRAAAPLAPAGPKAPAVRPASGAIGPGLAAGLSLVIPGVGQMAAGHVLRGLVFLLGGAPFLYFCGLLNVVAAWDAWRLATRARELSQKS